MNLIFFILSLFFTSFGVICFINFIQLILLTPTYQKNKNLILIPISGHIENIELLIKKYVIKYKIQPNFKYSNVFFVDTGLDFETKKICDKMITYYDNFNLCDKNQIYNIIKQNLK